MATEPYLRDVLVALKQKIQALSGTATAEDIAFLGKALESIVGRATALDIEMGGDAKLAELTTALNALQTSILAAIEAQRVAANTSIDNAKNTSIAAVNGIAMTPAKTFFLMQL